MTCGVQILDLGIVCPLVAHIHGGGDGAAVGVLAAHVEEVVIQALIEVVYGVVKCKKD